MQDDQDPRGSEREGQGAGTEPTPTEVGGASPTARGNAREEGRRLREIVSVLTRHHALVNLARQHHPEEVRRAFEELGPTFIKIGQILSVREDIVTPEFAEEFKRLQSDVPTDPFSAVKATVEQEMGMPLSEMFESFEETPIASASMAQVHRAVLKGGQEVAVKVQHPGIYETMTRDIGLFEKAVPLIKHAPGKNAVDPGDVVAELRTSLMEELDCRIEARNVEEFYRDNQGEPIRCARAYLQYCTRRMMIMDFVEGVGIASFIERADAGVEADDAHALAVKRRLAKVLTDNYMKQIFSDGFFHADPHPGNILVIDDDGQFTARDEAGTGAPEGRDAPPGRTSRDPRSPTAPAGILMSIVDEVSVSISTPFDALGDPDDRSRIDPDEGPERIVFLDFGMMGRLSEDMRDKLNRVLLAFGEKDVDAMTAAIVQLCTVTGPVDVDALTADVTAVFNRYIGLPIAQMSMPRLLDDITEVVTRHHLKVPGEITMMAKGVGTIEGIIVGLDPDASLTSALGPYLKEYARSRLDPRQELIALLGTLRQAAHAAPELPIKVNKLADKALAGTMRLTMDHKADDITRRMELMLSNLAMSVIAAALIIGSALLVRLNGTGGDVTTFVVSGAGMIGFVAALVLAGYMVWRTLKKKR